MASIVDAARAIAAALNAALEAAELGDGIQATTDPTQARTAALAGCGVLVGPPAYTWGGVLAGGVDVVWTITVAARPCPGVLDAWAVIDQVITAVQEVVDLDTARPGAMTDPAGGEPVPAYVLTTQPDTL